MTNQDVYNAAVLNGWPIYETEYLSEYVFCRRHKKKRINKKLVKKYGPKKIEVVGGLFFAEGKIFCSPKTAAVLKRMIKSHREALEKVKIGWTLG